MKRNFAEDLINRTLRRGVDEAGVYLKSSKNLSIEVKVPAVTRHSIGEIKIASCA